MRTSELEGAALDWAVAKCLHGNLFMEPYSTNWSLGGPIIERERILIQPELGKEGCGNAWNAISMHDTEAYGPTPLIAAMRCYVASKLGDDVEIPEELA